MKNKWDHGFHKNIELNKSFLNIANDKKCISAYKTDHVTLNIRVMMLKIQLRLNRNELHFNIKKQYIEKFF